MKIVTILYSLALSHGHPLSRTQQAKDCGKTYMHTWKMINNENVTFAHVPWSVVLSVKKSIGRSQSACEGALINEKFVVTRASCIREYSNDSIIAGLGVHNIPIGSGEYQPEYYGIRNKLMHENYDPMELWGNHDIALLELSSAVVFKKHIAPVCLPENGTSFMGETVSLTKFEKPLEKGVLVSSSSDKINITEIRSCSGLFHFNSFETRRDFYENRLCAEFKLDQAESPLGPLIFEKDGYAHLVGFRSSSVRCVRESCFAAYTKISNDAEWINTRTTPGFDRFNPRIAKIPDTYEHDLFLVQSAAVIVVYVLLMTLAYGCAN